MTGMLKEKKQKKKKNKKKKIIDLTDAFLSVKEDVYHLGCPSYPNCDIDPSGCIRESGINDVEWYGHRD
jgi:hypothetical protein